MTNRIEELMQFILEKSYKKRFNLENLDFLLGLEKDLGFDGDDAAEFLYDYSEKFKVNTDNFDFKQYFTPENPLTYLLYKLIPKFSPKKKELTIGDLIKGIEAGRLDEKVLAK